MANSVFIGFVGGIPYSTSGSTVSIAASWLPSADNTYDLGSASFQWRNGYLGTGLVFADAGTLTFGTTTPAILSRGAANTLLLAAGDLFALGGVGTSNPALSNAASTLEVVLANGSAYAPLKASIVKAGTSFGLGASDVLTISATAPTIASGFGTNPSIVASNGTAAFTVNVGTGGTASSGVITMPAATTGWIARVENLTGVLGNYANQRTVQIASSTTSITLENQTISTGAALAWTASDVLVVTAVAY